MNIAAHQSLKAAILLGGLLSLLTGMYYGTLPKESRLAQLASGVMRECEDSHYTPACYDEEIPKLMDRGLSMEEAFQVTTLIQRKDQEYWYCHVLGHNLSAKEAAKDLSRWTEVITRCPTGQCSNGCLHGAFQERFRDELLSPNELEELMPQLAMICESDNTKVFTGLETASCNHALGHLMMYITQADIKKSVILCDRLTELNGNDYRQVCYDGAFMQIYQPLEPEDFALIKDIEPKTQEQSKALCGEFSGMQYESCTRESWPLYVDELQDPQRLEQFCISMPSESGVRTCFNALFYIFAARFGFDEDRIFPLCEGLSDPWRGQCYANSASRILEVDYALIPNALRFCAEAERRGVGERCWKEMVFYSTFNFHKDSPSFTALCKSLPEPWSRQCFNGDGVSTHVNE